MKPFLKTKDHSVTGEPFDLILNEEQDMLITRPAPPQLEKYYLSNSYISHTDASKSFIDRCYQVVKSFALRKKIRLLERYAGNDRSVLDIGAGTGDFLRMARRRGWRFEGVEPNPMARGLATEKSLKLYRSLTELPDQEFQIITLWHVLEHLPDLNVQIPAILDHLKEDGTLFIAVPNFRSWDARYYGSFWAAYDVPRHLWHFSRPAINRIFSHWGMQEVSCKPMWFDAFYVSMLSERYQGNAFPFLRGIANGLRSNLKALWSGEYSSQLYILRKA